MNKDIFEDLTKLSHALGDPSEGMAILGEGNVSARSGEDRFLVKASGSELATLRDDQLTEVFFDPILSFLEDRNPSQSAVAEVLESSKVEKDSYRPSVETFLHAVCLSEAKASCVGHVHPEVVNALLCSDVPEEELIGPLYPDQIVVCGLKWLVLPYLDPGIELAYVLREKLSAFEAENGYYPKLILLENHGAVALGSSPLEVLSILRMAHKWARIAQGALSVGKLRFMPPEEARRIDGRDDEQVRRRALGLATSD
ncbi:MAG: class II aldolase/adducin family protein [Verrucomicrobiota bacterium]